MTIKALLGVSSASEKKLKSAIKNIFGFSPGNIFLYQQALRHKSASIIRKNGQKINNERQEYLGDAILGAVVADYLFKRFPNKDEGFLTEMRSKIVSRSSLNRLAAKLGIHELIRFSSADNRILKTAGGNAFEAFVGAMYLDKGYDFTHKILAKRILKVHFDIDELVSSEISYKSKIIEWAQKEKVELKFIIISEDSVKGQKEYTVSVSVNEKPIAQSVDYSIKGAENLAAEKAWTILFS